MNTNKLINELMSDLLSKKVVIKEEEEEREHLNPIRFPAVKITEAWGQRTSADRRVIELIAKNIKGTTVREKVNNLQAFIDGALTTDVSKKFTVAEILSKLMYLESFRSIIVEFNAAVTGFLFEALLAGTTEGEQIADPVDGSLPIEDILVGEKTPYSLKVLRKGGVVKGSFKNLVDYFAPSRPGAEGRDKITYLIVIKETNDEEKDRLLLKFYEFDITTDNFLEWIGHKNVKDREIRSPYEYYPGPEPDDALKRDGIKVTNDFSRPKLEVTKTGRPSDLFEKRQLRQYTPDQPRTFKIPKNLWSKARVRIAPSEVDGDHEDHILDAGTILDPELEYVLLQPGQEKTYLVTGPMVKAGIQNQAGEYMSKGDKLDEDQVYTMQIRQGKTEERMSDTKDFQRLYGNILSDSPELLDTSNPNFFEVLKNSSGYLKETQWHISSDYYIRRAELLGELSLSRKHIDKTAWTYVYAMKGEIRKVYNALTSLIENINLYFLGDNQKAGMDAVQNSADVHKYTKTSLGMDRPFTGREPYFDSPPVDKPYVTEAKKPSKFKLDSFIDMLLKHSL
tara:strand:- start:12694 stop:14388 length:1695 start_codon:yes stop_codon:yes gene_type:complete